MFRKFVAAGSSSDLDASSIYFSSIKKNKERCDFKREIQDRYPVIPWSRSFDLENWKVLSGVERTGPPGGGPARVPGRPAPGQRGAYRSTGHRSTELEPEIGVHHDDRSCRG